MQDLSAWNVLIVDDEPDNRGVLEFVLGSYKATVHAVETGQEFLKLLERERPTVLLIDIQMPGMSGIELLAKIHERPEWRKIPAIAITAYAMSGDQERILAAGFDGYVAKPLNVMRLIDDLGKMIADKWEQNGR
ncbi:MAG TPA: response regulator [Phototrophicaceae bacterium]|nr:response regulator [Phototrophicaceae bacterium]